MISKNKYKRRKYEYKNRRKSLRKQAIAEYGRVCCYCDKLLTDDEITLDHVKSLIMGGKNILTNIVIACQTCNQDKGSASL